MRVANDNLNNERALIRQFSAGDQAAFRSIFKEYYARVVFFVQRFSISREDAEDIVMESFSKLWSVRGNFDNISKIKAFLYTVSRNAAIDMLRRNNRITQVPLEDGYPDALFGDIGIVHAEVVGIIFREMEKLPDKCRQVLLLTYKEGLSTHEIAAKLEISVSNVTSQRSRGLSLLKIAVLNKYPTLAGLLLPELLLQLL